jgi:hypothetical protein
MRKRTYNFVNKDPVCDELANLVDAVGLRGPKNTGKIAILATCSKATVDGILYGDTKKPQNATVMGIATGLGYERQWVVSSGKWNLDDELKKGREHIKAQKKLMEKASKKKPAPRKRVKKGRHLKLVPKAA